MSAVRSKPELATHSEVSRMEFPRAAAKLKVCSEPGSSRIWRRQRDTSGSRVGRRSAKAVRGVQQRLRLALTVALMIAERDDKHVAQAWFQGLNPQLDDISPARLLRDGDYDDAGKRVLAAARAFMVRG